MTTLLARFDDAMNPVVVKEVRQAVQSRFVVAVMGLFLVASLGAVCIYLLGGNVSDTNFTAGRELFSMLQAVVAVTCIMFVPMYAAVRLSAERGGEHPDLLYVSTIHPMRIIWGKVCSSMLLALLIYSCVLPFMTLTFLMRGVDLPTMFMVVGVHLLVVFAAVACAVFLAALPVTPMLKAVMGLLFLGLPGWGATIAVAAGIGMAQFGVGWASDWEFWIIAGLVTLLVGGASVLLLLLAAAVIAPASANRALPIRGYLTTLCAFGLTAVLVIYYSTRGAGMMPDLDELLAFVWIIPTVSVACAAMLISTAERESWTPRMRRHIPRALWKRVPFWLLSSGSAGGVAWAVTLVVATFGVVFILIALGELDFGSRYSDAREVSVGWAVIAVYFYCYALTGVALRWPRRRTLMPPVATIYTMGLLVAGCLLPVILAYFADPRRGDQSETLLFLFNPFGAAVMWATEDEPAFWLASGVVVGLWCIVVTLACIPWFVGQVRGFQPLEPAPAPPAPIEAATP